MKNINIKIVFGILLSLVMFTSCEDEAASPIINSAALDGSLTFVLNESQYSNWTYVLSDANASKEMDALTCVQPDYGFTAAVTYTTQVSFANTFAEGTYQSLPTSINGEKVSVNTKEMNKAMIALHGGILPDPVVTKDVYVRLKAVVSEATNSPLNDSVATVKPLYSNVIMIKVQPYIEPLMAYTEVTPVPYYIVGLGDGAWNNSNEGLGKSLIPLNVVPGNKYNAQGAGEYVFTGYFQASRSFKLIRDIGSWSEQWGNKGGDGINNLISKAIAGEEPSNIKVPADGYYTITLNSINNTLKVEAAAITPPKMASVGLIGEFNGWAADVVMSPAETTNNHVWYVTYTFAANAASDGGCKFRANGNWDVNWGAATFPIGITTPGGKNIPYKAGKYTVIFNDIDASYYFIQ